MGTIAKRPSTIQIQGHALYLAEDPAVIRRQLDGQRLRYQPSLPLANNISTDEITPAWVCFYYDETLGRYALVGFRTGVIGKDDVKNGGYGVIVSGLSKGCGSSRETAPYAEQAAGCQLVVAQTIEKIYGQNCQNIGLLTTTDFTVLDRIEAGEAIPLSEFTRDLDPISKDIVEYGGLFQYNRARLAGEVTIAPLATPARPMTLVEKIIARSAIADAATGTTGLPGVKPGDALFVRCGIRFTHEYVTPMAESLFKQGFGPESRVADPESVFAFRDHLTFLGQIMPEKKKQEGLLDLADDMAVVQQSFCQRQGIRLYGEVSGGGSEAICHNAVLEDLALPGDIVAGSDSHTCTAGAVGCFAFGVGATDIANAWYTRDVRVKVPETVFIHMTGKLAGDVTAKDLMIALMAGSYFRDGKAIGQVLEFAGPALDGLGLDERAVLTNMAVEAGAFTGIIAADQEIVDTLCGLRGIDPSVFEGRLLRSDAEAEYVHRIDIDLGSVKPMVATPGDPRNGVAIDTLPDDVRIDIAYAGSCTGAKKADMDMYARVLGAAAAQGKRVHPGVSFYLQFGSQKIKSYAESKGYLDIFERVGAQLVNPSCGACINAGPGASTKTDQVTVSAINRNYPGRSGPGKVYLASPLVVAASAIAGRIVRPSELLE